MRNRDKELTKEVLRKVYNAGGRNDGLALLHKKGIVDKGKVRGAEYDRLNIVPFFDAVGRRDGKKYTAWQHRDRDVYGKKIKIHPIVGIDWSQAKELAYAILDIIGEDAPTKETLSARHDKKKQDEIKKKLEKFGI